MIGRILELFTAVVSMFLLPVGWIVQEYDAAQLKARQRELTQIMYSVEKQGYWNGEIMQKLEKVLEEGEMNSCEAWYKEPQGENERNLFQVFTKPDELAEYNGIKVYPLETGGLIKIRYRDSWYIFAVRDGLTDRSKEVKK